MPCVFLLGPDEWVQDAEQERPLWMAPAEGDTPFTPKDLRLGLAAHIAAVTEGSVTGIVMDCEPGEDFVACFQRIEDEHEIEHYFFIVPPDTKMHGTEWEAGMLARDFKYGRFPAINLFLHDALAEPDDTGARVPVFQRGQRTRYLTSLVSLAHNVRLWRDVEHLADQVAMTARAMLDTALEL